MDAHIFLAFMVEIMLLLVVAFLNRAQINPDAIPYIRISQYFFTGQTDLMISGFWGPMLSWLIVPFLPVFDDPLFAARMAIVISAVIFLFGSYCVLRAARLPKSGVVIGTWTTVLLGVSWSAAIISPDLLMAGLLCVGTSMMFTQKWPTNIIFSFCTGMVLGASYLAKSVALPVSVLSIAGIAGTLLITHQVRLRQAARGVAITGAGLLMVAGPWIGILSHKYGRPILSTSGPAAHAVIGPPDMARYHPTFRTYHKPQANRITSWEDPTSLVYKYWSPLENIDYAIHQVKILYRNGSLIIYRLKTFDLLGLGLVSAILGYFVASPWRSALQNERWRWSLIPIASLFLIYLPVYAEDTRYFLAAIPFLMVASFGFVLGLSNATTKNRTIQALVITCVAMSFVVGNEGFFRQAFDPVPNTDYLAAKSLARKLVEKHILGPVASVGEDRTGYYLAYLLGVPWFGQMQVVHDANEVLSSGAALIVLPRGLTLTEKLRDNPNLVSADKLLFGCGGDAGSFPFEVFLTRTRSAEESCSE